MIRKFFVVIAVVLLTVCMTACKQDVPEPEQSYPTLPEFDVNRTPAQQLEDAIDKTQQQNTYEICYGMVTAREGQSDEASRTQKVTPQQPLDRDALIAYLPLLPSREGFVADFCNSPLRIIPSNTGTIRYQLSDLEWKDAAAMLYGQAPEGDFSEALCEIAMEVDAQGRLSRLEIVLNQDDEELTVFLELTFAENP